MLKKMLALAAASIMVFAAGCNNAGNIGGSEATDVIKIGGIGPLTGSASSYGISVKQGAEVAIDEINAAGGVEGKQLELIFEDDENDEQKSLNAYSTLMDKNINVLMGSVTSACSIAVSGASEVDGILQITPSGSAKECAAAPNAFRICFTDPLQGEVMAQYIKDAGITKVAMIYNNGDEYSKGIHDAFATKAQEIGIEIVSDESFTKDDIDFKTQLTKVNSSGAECIFLPIYYSEVAMISEQAASLGIDLPYYGCDGWDGVIKQVDGDTKNLDGSTFLTPFVANDETPKIKDFVTKYNERFNADPDQFAADGYDAVYAIKLAVEHTGGDLSNEALIDAMTKINLDGLTGNMTFDTNGEPNKSAKVAVIENGAYIAK